MNGSTILRELVREVRGDTCAILAATPAHWAAWAPVGTANHILWHAGHALWLQDLMCVAPLAGQGELPRGWSDAFGMNSHPARLAEHGPLRDQIARLLKRQLERMLELLADLPDEELLQPSARLGSQRNLGGWILHGLHDEAKHSGEMYLLWKLCRAATAAEGGS